MLYNMKRVMKILDVGAQTRGRSRSMSSWDISLIEKRRGFELVAAAGDAAALVQIVYIGRLILAGGDWLGKSGTKCCRISETRQARIPAGAVTGQAPPSASAGSRPSPPYARNRAAE